MDKEQHDLLLSKLNEVKSIIDNYIDELADVEFIESPTTGKLIVIDFDDADLEDLLVDVDAAVERCQELSNTISSLL